MAEITGLSSNRTGKKVNVYLDGTFAFSLSSEVAIVQGIHVGDILSESRIRTLQKADLFQNCVDAALHFLRYRPRSELEIKRRLRSRRYGAATVEKVIAYLKLQGYIDDAAFTRYWTENRISFSPRSTRLIRQELIQKGVDSDTIECSIAGIDDAENAYRAGLKKSRMCTAEDYEQFKHRLYEHLKALGFNYEMIIETAERLWQERDDIRKESI